MDNQIDIENDVQENESFKTVIFNGNQSNDLRSNRKTNTFSNLSSNELNNMNENANLLSNELINPLTNKCSTLISNESIDNTDFKTFLENLSTDQTINNDDFENQLNLLTNHTTKDEELKQTIKDLFFPKNELNDCKKKYIQTYKFNKDRNNLLSGVNNDDQIQAANNLNTINMEFENDEKNSIELGFRSNENVRKRISSKLTRQERYQKYSCAICGIILIFIMWFVIGYITYNQIIKYHL